MKLSRWVGDAFQNLQLSSEGREFLQSRGLTESQVSRFKTWSSPKEVCPNKRFRISFGSRWEDLQGFLVFPYYGAGGRKLLGFEARSVREKKFADVRLPCARWNPVFYGMCQASHKIWDGSPLWVTEGIFDALSVERVIPEDHAVLATLTARFDRKQMTYVERFVKGEVFLMYDNDSTGREGSQVAIKNLKKRGVSCTEISYRGGKDPNDILLAEGVSGLKKVLRPYIF